jgi:hypothetical protein
MNGLLLWNLNVSKNTVNQYTFLNKSLGSNIAEMEQELVNLNYSIHENLLLNHNSIAEIEVKDLEGGIIDLHNLLKNSERILFWRIPDEPCTPCINELLSIIKSSTNVNLKNLIILQSKTSGKEDKTFDLLSQNIKTLVCKDLSIDFEKQEKSYFFSVDESMLTQDGYIPNTSDNDFIEEYINLVFKN